MLATLLGPPEVVVGVEPPHAANAVAATSPRTGIRAFITNLPIAALLRMSRIVIRGNFKRLGVACGVGLIIVAMNRRRLALAALALGLLGSRQGTCSPTSSGLGEPPTRSRAPASTPTSRWWRRPR